MINLKNRLIKRLLVIMSTMLFSALLANILVLNYTSFRDTLIVNEQKRLLTIADTIARTIENHIQSQCNALILLATDPDFHDSFIESSRLGDNDLNEHIKTYYQIQQTYIESVELLNTDGTLILAYPEFDEHAGVLENNALENFHSDLDGQYISKVIFDAENTPYLYLYQSIYIEDEVVGVIRVKVSVDSIYRDFVEPVKSGGKGYASVKTHEGIFIMHPKRDQLGNEVVALRKNKYPQYDWSDFEALVEGQKSGKSGSGIYHSIWVTEEKPVRIKKFNGYAPAHIGDAFWIVTVSSDFNETTSIIKENLYSTITVMTLIGLGAVGAALYIYSLRAKHRKMEVEARYLDQVKDLNEELLKSRRKFIKLFNTGSHLTIVMQAPTDIEGGLIITEANDFACKKLNYERDDLLGMTYKDFDVGLKREILIAHLKSTESNEQIQFETQLKTRDGKVFPVEVFAHRFELEDNFLIMFVARDISARIEQEEELEVNRAIMIYKSQLAAMGEMVGNIAHQWRQPLSSLALLNSNIQDAVLYGEVDDMNVEALFKKSKKVIKSMSQTIDDFRYFFRPIETKECFNIQHCISSTLDLCDERLKYHKIMVERIEDVPVTVRGYPNQLSQVVLNLIGNATDALIENRDEARMIKIKSYIADGFGCLEVYDNGGGASEQVLEKMFEPYFTTKGTESGTGLGLYMSRMIIEKNFNGKIVAENIRQGIVFKIFIPLSGEN